MKMIVSTCLIFILVQSCGQNYDPDLKNPDGNKSGYILTPLGCLVNGPWQINSETGHYNKALYVGDKEILSVGENYDTLQADLVFELHKDRSITYFLKSENGLNEQKDNGELKLVEQKESGFEGVAKIYTKGYWEVDFETRNILIHFDERNIPELKFTYTDLGNGFVNFQQISYYESVYEGETVKIKRVNSMYYGRLYHRF